MRPSPVVPFVLSLSLALAACGTPAPVKPVDSPAKPAADAKKADEKTTKKDDGKQAKKPAPGASILQARATADRGQQQTKKKQKKQGDSTVVAGGGGGYDCKAQPQNKCVGCVGLNKCYSYKCRSCVPQTEGGWRELQKAFPDKSALGTDAGGNYQMVYACAVGNALKMFGC